MTPWTIWFKTDDNPSWQPLDSCRSLPVGHYRLAARLPIPHKHLQWRWKFFSANGKVENHDFQGRTDQEGLISLLDLHTVQPGTWQLSAQPDLFDQLCGENWQIRFQFQVVTPAMATVTVPKLSAEPEKSKLEVGNSQADGENNAIVPHPLRPMVVPELDPEPLPTLQWSRKTRVKLTENRMTDSSSPLEILETEATNEEQVLEPEVLITPAIAAQEEIIPAGVEEMLEPGAYQETEEIKPAEVSIHPIIAEDEKTIQKEEPEEILEPVIATIMAIEDENEQLLEPVATAPLSTEAPADADKEKSGQFTPFRSVSYSVELIYPELANPIQVDITVMVDENRRPANLNLPDPRRMISSLHRQPNKSRSPLPPKLTSTVD
ncbi:hypothetical protein [Synechocystis salina]|uniref:Uncharacterized protein n=1 Tax=Synechocystis salina LEGE 00031 TaxID=1828736 RepID=A0ABR9VUG4_9SYNC|nr:hypothetical protein [Synechocystis salina]MBE9241695.1 hypothetical protein [Synechocystis salina LEGE 00041]MBE9255001.1 hypothetical protein [Synechocystis salina LEGE 00031]